MTTFSNRCIKESMWSDCFKVTRVPPLHKKGIDNFRPTIVPVFSKVFEILLKDKLQSYFESKPMLSPCQFGFRKNHSTIGAMIVVLEDLVQGLDCRKNTHASI